MLSLVIIITKDYFLQPIFRVRCNLALRAVVNYRLLGLVQCSRLLQRRVSAISLLLSDYVFILLYGD